MNITKTIRITLTMMGFALATMSAQAQDLMVRQATIDAKMRTIDSLSITRMLHHESMIDPAFDLYNDWTNSYVRYDKPRPAEYKIDLRGFHMPCDHRLVTSHYGYRSRFGRNHYGTDLKVYIGDTVRAAFDGKVRVVANEGAKKGYGKYVIIRHPNGLETLYGHLSKQIVAENMTVKAGEPIGLGGNTGRSTGPHLHFETRFLGDFINPELLFCFEASDVRGDYYLYRSSGRGTLLSAHEAASVANSEILVETTAPARVQPQVTRSQVYKVKKGDTLSSIAKRYHTTVDKLRKLNRMTAKSVLRPGQIIKCS